MPQKDAHKEKKNEKPRLLKRLPFLLFYLIANLTMLLKYFLRKQNMNFRNCQKIYKVF